MSVPEPAPVLRLRIVAADDPEVVGRELPVIAVPAVLGRVPECAVPVPDPLVSRRHAEIVQDGDRGFAIVDSGSSNGIWSGDERLPRIPLTDGVRFRVGTTTLEVEVPGPTSAVLGGATQFLPRLAPEGSVEEDEDAAAPAPDQPASGPPGSLGTLFPQLAARRGLLELGRPEAASGNRPFLLDDPGSGWIVETGRVEIFTVGVEAGRPVGARSHYLTVEPGEGFFGMDLARYQLPSGFLAVGRTGTVLRRIPVAALRRAAVEGRHREEIASVVEGWVGGLSRRLTREILPGPTVDVSLAVGQEAALENAARARSAKGVVWLEAEAGRLLFVDMETLDLSAHGVFPITPDSWVEAANPFGGAVRLNGRDGAELVAGVRLWQGLADFHDLLCRCEFLNKRLAAVDELNRLRTKEAHAVAAKAAAYRELAGVLMERTGEVPTVSTAGGADLVLPTLRLVGEAIGAEIKGHPDLAQVDTYPAKVALLAKASGVRIRVVALRGDWWKEDQGPLLARWEGSETPVAILSRGPGRYDCVDLAAGTRRKVDDELAAALQPFAFTLYRPFPLGELSVRDLMRFGARDLGRDLGMLVAMGIGLGLLGSLTPTFTGMVFDAAIPHAERFLLIQLAVALAIAAIASGAFKLTQGIAILRVQGRMDYSVQAGLWDRLLDLPSTFFKAYSSGDLADRAAGINAIRNLVAGAGVSAILGSLSSVFYVALMFVYSVPLALLAVGLTALFVGFTTAANYFQLRHQRAEFEVRGRLTGMILQLISGVSKLRVAGAENHALRVWAEQFASQRQISFRIGRIQNAVAVFGSGFPVISSMSLFLLLSTIQDRAAAQGGGPLLTTGDFIAFSAAYGMFLAAMQALSDASLSMLQIVPIYERLKPILTTLPEVDGTKAYPGRLKGAIELSHLHFRYGEDGPWVIRDLTLRIEPGEFVAFVGPSGSGKSTVMRLMLGFETAQKGSVYYDGQDLGNLDLREVRQQMGVVLQESRLLPADIFTNIVGATSRTLDEAWEAAKMAGFEADIREMPMGMHTYVSEGGGGLSGGQRQRLLIARAIVNRPRIIFMDEATSALDNRTQAVVTESLERLQATRIVIAHRLSTVINADRICYLESGVVREVGTYEELMERNGLFAALARRQIA